LIEPTPVGGQPRSANAAETRQAPKEIPPQTVRAFKGGMA
jgi:hypothetical protein